MRKKKSRAVMRRMKKEALEFVKLIPLIVAVITGWELGKISFF